MVGYEDVATIHLIASIGKCLPVPYNPLPSSSFPQINLSSQWRDHHPDIHLDDPKPSLLHNPSLSSLSPSPVGLFLLPLPYSGSYHCRPEWLPYPLPHWLVKSNTTHHYISHLCLHFHPSISPLWMQPWYFSPKRHVTSWPESLHLSEYHSNSLVYDTWFMTRFCLHL